MPIHIFNTFDDPSGITGTTQAFGVNDTDQIVGLYQTASVFHGFLESGGTYTPLDDPSATTATVAQGMEHGASKYLSLPVSPLTGVAPMSLSGINGMIELVGGVLIVLGLFTRPVAFILAGDMAVAYFIAHAPRGFFPLLNAGELAIIYCFVFLYLA